MGKDLSPHPRTYLKFPRDQSGCIAIVPFFTFVVRKADESESMPKLKIPESPKSGLDNWNRVLVVYGSTANVHVC